jgi:hypothetical protein
MMARASVSECGLPQRSDWIGISKTGLPTGSFRKLANLSAKMVLTLLGADRRSIGRRGPGLPPAGGGQSECSITISDRPAATRFTSTRPPIRSASPPT